MHTIVNLPQFIDLQGNFSEKHLQNLIQYLTELHMIVANVDYFAYFFFSNI